MKKLLISSSLFLAAIIAGCGSQVVEFPEGADTTDGGTPDGDSGNGPCVDSNCPVGQVCQNNVCTPVDPCDGVTCPAGSICRDGSCTSEDPCEGVTCPNGQCVDGQCPPPACDGGSCPTDGGPPKDPCDGVCCPKNKECKNGACVPKDPCAGVQCPESRVCKNGQCVCAGDPKDDDDDDGCGRNKTLICHKDCKGKRHNICVSNNAVPAHKKHGDKVGDCSVCR